MIITIASGKGGTGKTTITVNLAASAPAGEVEVFDCDVEEPNSHIFLKPGNLIVSQTLIIQRLKCSSLRKRLLDLSRELEI